MKKLYRCDVCREGKDKDEVGEFTEVIKKATEESGECRRTYWVCKKVHKGEE